MTGSVNLAFNHSINSVTHSISQQSTEETLLSAAWIEHTKAKECWKQLIANGSLQIEQKGPFLIIKWQKATLSLQSATAVETLIEVCAENRVGVTSFEFHCFQFLGKQSNHSLEALAVKLRRDYAAQGVVFEACHVTSEALEKFIYEIDIPMGQPPIFQNFKTLSIRSQLIDESFVQSLTNFIKFSRQQNHLFLNNCQLSAGFLNLLARTVPLEVRFPEDFAMGHQIVDEALLKELKKWVEGCMIGGALHLVNCGLNFSNLHFIREALIQQEQGILTVVNQTQRPPATSSKDIDPSRYGLHGLSVLRVLNLSCNPLSTEGAISIFEAGKQLNKVDFSNCGIHCFEFLSSALPHLQEGMEIVLCNNVYDQAYPLFMEELTAAALLSLKDVKIVLDRKPETDAMYEHLREFFKEFPGIKILRKIYVPPRQYQNVPSYSRSESSTSTTSTLPLGTRPGDQMAQMLQASLLSFNLGGVSADPLEEVLKNPPVDDRELQQRLLVGLNKPNSVVTIQDQELVIELSSQEVSDRALKCLLESIANSMHIQGVAKLVFNKVPLRGEVISSVAAIFNASPTFTNLALGSCFFPLESMRTLLNSLDISRLQAFLFLNQSVNERYIAALMLELEKFQNLKEIIFNLKGENASQCKSISQLIDQSDFMRRLKKQFPEVFAMNETDFSKCVIDYSFLPPTEENLGSAVATKEYSKMDQLASQVISKNLSADLLKEILTYSEPEDKIRLFKLLLGKHFSINDVHKDGDCVYSSILHTTKMLPEIYSNVEELRNAVADYFEAHSQDYLTFITPEYSSALDEQQRIQETAMRIRQHAYLGRSGFWAGDLELGVMSDLFKFLGINQPLHIYDMDYYDSRLAGTYIQNGMLMPPPSLIYNEEKDEEPIYLLRSQNHYHFLTKLRVSGKRSSEGSKDVDDDLLTKIARMGE